ncbi:MAG: hypothetical protein IPM79_11985 [Polyangiaceae bacterium]|jgi:hypothetical protein|nr:hypothetical protein [Polyangiaceae bacterium]MBK8938332.1 hypothetical protein [Polyangiaceae bacterium]
MAPRALRQLVPGVVLVAALGGGCAPTTSAQLAKDLSSLDAATRADAASCLERRAREQGELPGDVLEAILQQAPRETDPVARASMMRTLGHTGDVRAKEVLDAYARTDDGSQRAVASAALQAWAVAAGKVPPGHAFSPEWPYGTEAYPPRK